MSKKAIEALRKELAELKKAKSAPGTQPEPAKKREFKIREFKPDLGKIDADTDVSELLGKLVAAVNAHVSGVISDYDQHQAAVKSDEQQLVHREQTAKQVRAFKEGHPDFEKHLPRMEELFAKGLPIEECYRIAKLEAGEDPEAIPGKSGKDGKQKPAKQAVVEEEDEEDDEDEEDLGASAVHSDDEEDEDEVKNTSRNNTKASVTDKIKARVSDTIAKHPSLASFIDGE